jgi:Arc/MetJ-type ribon-helix-helix transcriptional regulator
METVAAKLPKSLVEAVDGIVAAGAFPNRSEVVRVAIREFVEGRSRAGRASTKSTATRRLAHVRTLQALARDPRYRNRFVALFQGRVLDSDDELHALVQRVLKRPEHPVFVERATERGEPIVAHMPGVRVRP